MAKKDSHDLDRDQDSSRPEKQASSTKAIDLCP